MDGLTTKEAEQRLSKYGKNVLEQSKKKSPIKLFLGQFKDVMTQSGRILELYVYYKILAFGLFDDVANSVEIHWNNDEAENEIDIIPQKAIKFLS